MNNSYLDKLLEGVEVEWMALGEVCNIFTGGEQIGRASCRERVPPPV